MNQLNISFAGAGRVANALCKEMYNYGYHIDLIVSETQRTGCLLSDFCSASWSSELIFPESTDIIFVAVPDHRLKSVLHNLKCRTGTIVVHTAGSMGLDIFPDHIVNKGVFYPLQTFSKERKVSFKDLPVLIETINNKSERILVSLAEAIGGKVHYMDTDHRRMVHLAAVFACNFTNHMLTGGKEVVMKAGLPFDILFPLIKETISKAIETGPENSQTGPAVRNDQNTIEKHLELLSFSSDLQRIYSEITRSIIKYHNKS
jgi:predicted short-subunit dehydrogenase-like oxidoreductase (DUF2520 family)